MEATRYTLYSFPFSLFSLMARYTIALCGPPLSPSRDMPITVQTIDLHADENLSEHYLTSIKPRGQVPALASPQLPEPLTSTLEMTRLLGASYPSLYPPVHVAVIEKLLGQLHAIQPLSLSVSMSAAKATSGEGHHSKEQEPAPLLRNPGLEERLAHPETSESYRSALRFKAEFHNRTLGGALRPDAVRRAEEQSRAFLEGVRSLIAETEAAVEMNVGREGKAEGVKHDRIAASWIFGNRTGPTALDAHTVPFVARLMDWGRDELIPAEVRRYAEWAMSREEWLSVTNGKPTAFMVWVEKMREQHKAQNIQESVREWFGKKMRECGLLMAQ